MPKHLQAWTRSAAFRAIALRTLEATRERLRTAPKCEAVRRSDGGKCQNPAGENGRCRFHGGAVPKGRRWHKIELTGGTDKVERRLRDQASRERKRAERLAAMTPKEREAHERWQATHAPTSPAARAQRRADREAAREIRARSESGAPDPVSPEAEAIREAKRALADRLAALQAIPVAEDDGKPTNQNDEGVFG